MNAEQALKVARGALELAQAICDAVPTRLHKNTDGDWKSHLGNLVNYREDGTHGYAAISAAIMAIDSVAPPVAEAIPAQTWSCARCGATTAESCDAVGCHGHEMDGNDEPSHLASLHPVSQVRTWVQDLRNEPQVGAINGGLIIQMLECYAYLLEERQKTANSAHVIPAQPEIPAQTGIGALAGIDESKLETLLGKLLYAEVVSAMTAYGQQQREEGRREGAKIASRGWTQIEAELRERAEKAEARIEEMQRIQFDKHTIIIHKQVVIDRLMAQLAAMTGVPAKPVTERSPMAQVSDLACAARDLAAKYGMVLRVYQAPRTVGEGQETVVSVRIQ